MVVDTFLNMMQQNIHDSMVVCTRVVAMVTGKLTPLVSSLMCGEG